MPSAVGVGAVEHGDAAVERVMDQRHRIVVAARAVHAGQRHAAKSDRRHRDAGGTERAARQLCNWVHLLSSRLLVAAVQRDARLLPKFCRRGFDPPPLVAMCAPHRVVYCARRTWRVTARTTKVTQPIVATTDATGQAE